MRSTGKAPAEVFALILTGYRTSTQWLKLLSRQVSRAPGAPPSKTKDCMNWTTYPQRTTCPSPLSYTLYLVSTVMRPFHCRVTRPAIPKEVVHHTLWAWLLGPGHPGLPHDGHSLAPGCFLPAPQQSSAHPWVVTGTAPWI